MGRLYVLTHPDVVIDPEVPVPLWPLSERGRQRIQGFLNEPWLSDVTAIYCSSEQKALDTAEIVAQALSLPFEICEQLGENDRSATGYLPNAEFIEVATWFFAHPEQSIRGWETALQAQQRFLDAIEYILQAHTADDTVLVVCHGGVASLYLAHLQGFATALHTQQPDTNGGNYFCVDIATRSLVHAWQSIDRELKSRSFPLS
jgi:broad specificity phosphatase PhoE